MQHRRRDVYNVAMPILGTISHDRREETLEAKARWFRSLSVEERMDYLCAVTDLVLENNPRVLNVKHAQSVARGDRVLTRR